MQGQIAETVGPRDADPIEHYLQVIADKTGSLIGTSARFGAMFGGAPAAMTEALADYGDTIGVAFQLSDDLLDIASESAESGKTPGTDLREGVPTLPVLYALADDATDASAIRLREILASGPMTDDALVAEALELLRRLGRAQAGPGDRARVRRTGPRPARRPTGRPGPRTPSSRWPTSSPTAPPDPALACSGGSGARGTLPTRSLSGTVGPSTATGPTEAIPRDAMRGAVRPLQLDPVDLVWARWVIAVSVHLLPGLGDPGAELLPGRRRGGRRRPGGASTGRVPPS